MLISTYLHTRVTSISNKANLLHLHSKFPQIILLCHLIIPPLTLTCFLVSTTITPSITSKNQLPIIKFPAFHIFLRRISNRIKLCTLQSLNIYLCLSLINILFLSLLSAKRVVMIHSYIKLTLLTYDNHR